MRTLLRLACVCSLWSAPLVAPALAGDYVVPPNISLIESIVYGNNDDIVNNTGSNYYVRYSDIGDSDFTGELGVFHADPLFVNPAAGDYHLQAGSPCIDAGFPNFPADPDCSRSDVGAFAFAHAPFASYCTAKLNSCGSLPTISGSGAPSASAGSGFVVSAAHTKGTKAGLLMYSDSGRANLPFSGGILCVNAPVRRIIAVLDTTGTPGQCNGSLSIDMNAFATGSLGGNPPPSLLVGSTKVDCQFWGRDTPATSLLSDALEYFICPE